MAVADVAWVVVGIVTIGVALRSVVVTLVLPRGVESWLANRTIEAVHSTLRMVARRLPHPRSDDVLALVTPLAVLTLPFVWLTVLTAGFAALFTVSGPRSVEEAWILSGSSLLSLGFADVDGPLEATMAFTEVTMGLGLIALLIAYLPTIYASFQRRESAVALLQVRAGSPATATTLLLRYHRIGGADDLHDLWIDWEAWFADIDESHTTFAALIYLRSPSPDRSWLVAAGTVLDAASLSLSSLELEREPRAHLTIRAGFLALRRISDVAGIQHDPDPAPGDPIAIDRSEFERALDELEAGGLPVRADRDAAWRDFAGWRVNYDRTLLSLSTHVDAPIAPWTSDRGPVGGIDRRRSQRRVRRTRRQSHADTRAGTRLRRR